MNTWVELPGQPEKIGRLFFGFSLTDWSVKGKQVICFYRRLDGTVTKHESPPDKWYQEAR